MIRVSFQNVTKRYKGSASPALSNISLEIPPRGIFGLLGPNGAGKSTFLRLIATLSRPTKGRVIVGDHESTREPAQVRKLIGYVPQEYTLYPNLTAWEFLDYMALLSGIKQRRQRIEEVLEMVGLRQVAHRGLKTFSGGMKQRVAIAQALLHRPPLLLIDEPTTGLDPEERVRFIEWVLAYGNQNTIVFSTHFVEDVSLTCDHVAILYQGTLLFCGRPSDLIRKAEGKVWRASVPREQWLIMQKQAVIIESRIREEMPGWVEVRYLDDGPSPSNAAMKEVVKPSLKDAYFYLLKQQEVALEPETEHILGDSLV